MDQTLKYSIFACIFLAVIIMVFSQILAKKIARPIELIAGVATKIANGDIASALSQLPEDREDNI